MRARLDPSGMRPTRARARGRRRGRAKGSRRRRPGHGREDPALRLKGGGGQGGSGTPGGGQGGTGTPGDGTGGDGKGGEGKGGDGKGGKSKPRSRGKGRPRTRRPSSGGSSGGAAPRRPSAPPIRGPGGAPTPANPGYFDGSPGDNPLAGMPNPTLRHFRIPPFLLPIYHAAATEYGIGWEYLAAINEVETAFGRNLNVSSAGALGWMQFMPATWKQYGVDANDDGRKDPFSPVDSIFAAARYLKAAGAPENVRKAIFAYNHANWYVDSIVLRARLFAGMSADLVGSLTGLAEARFPVRGRVKYADDVTEREARKRVKPGQNPANEIKDDPNRKGIRIFAKKGAAVIAVNDGVVERIGTSRRLGHYVVLRDNFGNHFTYANLGSIAKRYPAPKQDVQNRQLRAAATIPPGLTANDRCPTAAASAGRQVDGSGGAGGGLAAALPGQEAASGQAGGSRYQDEVVKERLFAIRIAATRSPRAAPSRSPPTGATRSTRPTPSAATSSTRAGFDPDDFTLAPLREGSRVMGDTIIGRARNSDGEDLDPNVYFEIRPAGKGAPKINPKPLLDGWKLLEATAIYRASGKNVLHGDTSIGQILMMSKHMLQKRVLGDPRIDIYDCGRKDIRSGQVSRQVLAAIAYLTESGLKPTITSLKCGHRYYTTSGNVSHHSSGNAVDIARWNGQPVLGHQQKNGLTYQAIKRLLLLQGTMKPTQLISLFNMGPPTLRMGNHADHLHIGYWPAGGSGRGRAGAPVLKRSDWFKLIDRLGEIYNPAVARRPPKYSFPARGRRSSGAHRGE
jgi:hypothetical protein